MTPILVMVLAAATTTGEAGDPESPPSVPSVPRAPAPQPSRAPALTPAPGPAANDSLAPPDLKRWYGWEMILGDAAFVTLASRSHWSGAGFIGAGLGITVGTPLLHAINGNGDAWRWSTIGRSMAWVAAFFAALGVGALSASGPGKNDGPTVIGAGVLVVGGGIFVLIDDFGFANRPAPPASARFTAAVLPAPGGATMGLGGVF